MDPMRWYDLEIGFQSIDFGDRQLKVAFEWQKLG